MEQKLDLGNFGGNLKRLVKQFNNTHEQSFEDLIGKKGIVYEYSLIYHYFNGSKRPSLEMLIDLADILGVSLEDLLS